MTMTERNVRKTVTVPAPVDKTFKVFTEGIERWWTPGHHIGEAELKEIVLEGRAGGCWYEIGIDGIECNWGHVLVWEPPGRIVLAWQISSNWQFDPDLVTEVEVRFVAAGPHSTRVELEHRNLDRFGPEAEGMREQFNAPGGWQGLLEAFAAGTSA